MVGQQHLGAGADPEIVEIDACRGQACHLGQQRLRIDHAAGADDVLGGGVEDAGGDEVQGVLAECVDDGVAGVVAALEADDDIGLLGQIVDDAAFAFVAPLGAYNCGNGHGFR